MSWLHFIFAGTLTLLLLGLVGLVVRPILYVRFLWASERDIRERFDALKDIVALLREGKAPSAERLREAARHPRIRRDLYAMLFFHERLNLFPREFLTWEAFAEGEMVEWLCHPNELGRVPDEMELMAKVPAQDRAARHYFVFRFRVHPPHWSAGEGWLAGVAGTYDLRSEPKPGSGRDTFSRFESYDSRTPEEHVQCICETMSARDRERLAPGNLPSLSAFSSMVSAAVGLRIKRGEKSQG